MLIKLLLSKAAFNKYFSVIDLQSVRDNYKEVWYIYHCLLELHEAFPDHQTFTLDELQTYFWAQYPDANKEIYTALFTQLVEASIDEHVGDTILASIERRKRLLALSEQAYKASQGMADLQSVKDLSDGLEKSTTPELEADSFITTNLEEIVRDTVSLPGIRWPLECLNKALGSLRRGDFGFVFARPETGKTTFIASVAASALDQVSQPIIWFNNEEVDSKVLLRIVQSYFGIKLDVLMANVKKYNELFNSRVGGRILLVNSSRVEISKQSIERIVEAKKPSLIIYDQIDKIKGFKADRDDLVYGAIYQWARELAKYYAPSIGVCQADGSGEGQKWLSMGNVANAKTSKQAEADFILGIGRSNDEAAEYIRYFNISKNKLLGDKDSEPSMRHARIECLIQPELARYKDVLDYT